MDPGMLMVLEVKTYIEHREVEKVRHKYSGVTYRFGGSLLDTIPNAGHTKSNFSVHTVGMWGPLRAPLLLFPFLPWVHRTILAVVRGAERDDILFRFLPRGQNCGCPALSSIQSLT
jgi:hypothetical protein